MKVVVIGTGYVGLVSGVCLAAVGHEVTCVDVLQEKIDMLLEGKSPIFETGLEALIEKHSGKNLFFTTDLSSVCAGSDAVMIAVGTPQGDDGNADLTAVYAVAEEISVCLKDILIDNRGVKKPVVIVKSTVPVGTGDRVETIVNFRTSQKVHVASNPEFLKEGVAVEDFMRPDRVVVGLNNGSMAACTELFVEMYSAFMRDDPSKLIFMDRRSSEMTKYAANCMLATRISFMNELSQLCDAVGANVDSIRFGIGADPRIGKKFLYAGAGYGGSCFPKDVSALAYTGKSYGVPMTMLDAATTINERQAEFCARKVFAMMGHSLPGKRITFWGLSFKPKTDDVRDSLAAEIMKHLIALGATEFVLTDPQAMETFQRAYPHFVPNAMFSNDQYEAVTDSDALVLVTEWAEYRRPDWEKIGRLMRTKAVADLRNQYVPSQVRGFGFEYVGVGRQK